MKMVLIRGDDICPLPYIDQKFIDLPDDEFSVPVISEGLEPFGELNEGGLSGSAEYLPCLDKKLGKRDSSSSHDTAEPLSRFAGQNGGLPPSPVACTRVHMHTDNRMLPVDSSSNFGDAQLSPDIEPRSSSKLVYMDALPETSENAQLIRPDKVHHLPPKAMKVNEVPDAPAAAAFPGTAQTAEAELQRWRMDTIIQSDGDDDAYFPDLPVQGTVRTQGQQRQSARSVGPALSSVCRQCSVYEDNTEDGDDATVGDGDATDAETVVFATGKRQSSGYSCAVPSRSSAAAADQASDAHVASVRQGGEELVDPVEPEVSSLPAPSMHPRFATAFAQEDLQDLLTTRLRRLLTTDVEAEKQLEPPSKRPCRMRSLISIQEEMDVDTSITDGDDGDDDDYTLQPPCGGWSRKNQICQGRPAKNLVSGSVCIECGATWTPQWRTGPDGPRTLCNACGVRYGKLLKQQAENAQRTSRLRKRKNN